VLASFEPPLKVLCYDGLAEKNKSKFRLHHLHLRHIHRSMVLSITQIKVSHILGRRLITLPFVHLFQYHQLRPRLRPLHRNHNHPRHQPDHRIIIIQHSPYPLLLRCRKESMTSVRTMSSMSSHKAHQQPSHHGKILCRLCLAMRLNGTRSAFS